MKAKKHHFLALALAALCATANAEWVEVSRFDDGMRVYVDRSTVRRDADDTAQLTHLVRWGEPQQDPGQAPYLSTVVRTLYDCAGKQERYLASTSYAGAMGDGATIIADEDAADDWYSISEASLENKLWSVACAAR